jgi:hypothetical protein
VQVAIKTNLVEHLCDDRLDELRDEVADDQDHEEADQVRNELEERVESLLEAGRQINCEESFHPSSFRWCHPTVPGRRAP